MTPDPWREVRARVAQRLLRRSPVLIQELRQAVLRHIPELLDGDPAMGTVLDAMVNQVIQVTLKGIVTLHPVSPPEPTSPTLAFARRLGERGIPAYRTLLIGQIAQRWLLGRVLAEINLVAPQPPLQLVAPVVSWQLEAFGVLGDAVGAQHAIAQEQTRAALGGVAPEDVAFALEVAEDEEQIEGLLHYGLNERHLGFVVWSRHGTVRGNRLLQLVRTLAGLRPIQDLLVSPRDMTSMNAWAAVPGPVRQAMLQVRRVLGAAPDVRVAFGESGSGLQGFRQTFHQAEAAYRVALLPGSLAEPLVRYREVSVASLLSQQAGEVEPWVATVLGDLATSTEDCGRLRETLRVYLEAGENASAAAQQLYVHRNTVKYRVAQAIALLGMPFETNRLAVGVALNYHRRAIGDAVGGGGSSTVDA